jgi:hypothetical protein
VAPLADTAWARFVGVVPSGVFPQFGTDGTTAALAVGYAVLLLGLAVGGRLARHTGVIHERDDAPR